MQVLTESFMTDCGRLTETEETTEKNPHNQQRYSYEELASFSDRWHEGITHSTLPHLYQFRESANAVCSASGLTVMPQTHLRGRNIS